MQRVILLILGIIVVVVALVLVIWGISALDGGDSKENGDLPNQGFGIASFEECVAAGYPVMESNPRQCRTPDGTVFIEDGGVQPGSGDVNTNDAQDPAPSQPDYNYGY